MGGLVLNRGAGPAIVCSFGIDFLSRSSPYDHPSSFMRTGFVGLELRSVNILVAIDEPGWPHDDIIENNNVSLSIHQSQ